MDPRLPFWVAAGLSFANTLYGFLILPELLTPERRAPFRWRSANPLGALGLLRSDRILTGLSVVNFIAQLAPPAESVGIDPRRRRRRNWRRVLSSFQTAIKGTRMPPSYTSRLIPCRIPLLSKNSGSLPPSRWGPLSLLKMIRVLPRSPAGRSSGRCLPRIYPVLRPSRHQLHEDRAGRRHSQIFSISRSLRGGSLNFFT